jgi:predicted esterase
MTREDRSNEIADYVFYLDALLRELRRRVAADVSVTALGFSQGAATVSRWVAASRPVLRELVLWGGLLPPEFNEPGSLGGLTAQPIRLVVGSEDRYLGPSLVQKELERLERLGLKVNPFSFQGGHTIDGGSLRSLA